MEKASPLAQKLLLGSALSAALVALGLAMTGNSARALQWTPGPSAGGFHVLNGASQTVEQVQINGQPTEVLVCVSPDRTPQSVLEHYRRVAEGETPTQIPYLLEERADHGGSVLWRTVDGRRKAVLVTPHPNGGTIFRLILEPTLGDDAPRQQAADPILPGGLAAPDGFEVKFCVNDGRGIGSAVLEAPGTCRDAAAGLLAELAARGFTPAEEAVETYAARDSATRLALPLRHRSGELSGHLSVSATDSGARLCLTVRPGA